jgi:branched-chain amino acid transport system permease protein
MFGVSSTTIFLAVVASLGLGSVYALMALSFNTVVATTDLFHFTLGSFLMLGTVFSYLLGEQWRWPLYAVVPVLVAIGAVLGVISYYVAVLPVFRRARHAPTAILISTLALSLIIDGFTRVRFGPDEQSVRAYVDHAPFMLGKVPVRPVFIVMAVVLLACVIAFEVVLRTTGVGRLLRSSQEDPVAVELAGVSIRAVHLGVFAFAGAIAVLAGFLVAPVSYASPNVGTTLLLFGFAAMAIGGFGSVAGSVIGGLLVGLITNVLPVFFTPSVATPALFALLVVLLLVRPSGLLGRAAIRDV